MFTGLIADLGRLDTLDSGDDGARLTVCTELARQLSEGDSIAVNGVCLTATAVADSSFCADVMSETLRRSALGALRPGAPLNLELALRAEDRLGGHLVQGHVDAVGTVRDVRSDGFARVVSITAGEEVLRYVVQKGSIAVDGISLTVSHVDGDEFAVSVIPETLTHTSMGSVGAGQDVNIEVDVLAKYVEKLLGATQPVLGA